MSTRSNIRVLCSDNKVRSVYCHFDGYGHLPTLQENYNSQELAERLVALGDLSSLAESMECPEGHDFENQVDGYCVAYCRDRDEPWDEEQPELSTYQKIVLEFGVKPFDMPRIKHGVGFRTYDSFQEAWDDNQDSWIEYVYEWDGAWKKYDCHKAKSRSECQVAV